MLIANHILVRKSEKSVELVTEWMHHCENETYINGENDRPNFPEFKHYTPEQSILAVIISNWILKRLIPEKYPNVTFYNRNLSNFEIC